ncbi:MAG: Rrf2 family transcriptional regulator [Saprospiraceae bacterium]
MSDIKMFYVPLLPQARIKMFSKACEYGIKAVIHISHQSQKGEKASLKAVAKAIDSPIAFTAKILQSLVNTHVVISSKGTSGGYEIPEDKYVSMTIFDIVKAIDGDKIYDGCGLGLKQCNEKRPCPFHDQFKAIRDNLKNSSQNTTIQDMVRDVQNGLTFLK